MSNEPTPAVQIFDAIVTHWLRTGQPVTVRDIAAACGRGVTWVRNHIERVDWRDIDSVSVRVPTIGKDYGTIVGSRSVPAYEPSKAALRKLLNTRNTTEQEHSTP